MSKLLTSSTYIVGTGDMESLHIVGSGDMKSLS